MHGVQPVEYRHPALEPILHETYGILIYQEQLMRAVIELAGFAPSEADDLRKAVSKKNADAIRKHRAKFIEGAGKQMRIPESQAADIFDDWEGFARYGFNKAHAADYGVICAQTAYLKAHYPVEFMTALLSVSKDETEKVGFYIADCRRMGIDVLPPDLGRSGWDFTIEERPKGGYAIRYGLGAVKNVGEGAVNEILVERERGGAFRTLDELAGRVDLRRVGKRALESLVKVGALDSLGERTAILNTLDCILSVSASHSRAKEAGQISLFSASPGGPMETITLAAGGSVPRRTMLAWEKELLGLYVSDHPLAAYREELEQIVTHWSADLAEAAHQQKVRVAGMVTHIRPFQSRNGRPMAFATIEDLQGAIEIILFPTVWERCKEIVTEDAVLVVAGKAESGSGTPRVLADSVTADLKKALAAARKAGGPRAPVPPAVPPPAEEDWFPPPEDAMADGNGTNQTAGAAGTGPAGMSDPLTIPPAMIVPPAVQEAPAGRDILPVAAAGIDGEGMPKPRPAAAGAPGADPAGTDMPFASAAPAVTNSAGAVIPFTAAAPVKIEGPRLILLYIRESGDRARDTRRLRILYGLLTSYPGTDHFAFQISESERTYRLEFPANTTSWTADLERQVLHLVGAGCIEVQPLNVQ
jgi:DNA polymerase-3 subunit alpha